MVCRSTPFLARWNPALLFILIVAAVWQPCPLRAQTYSSPITLYTFSGPDGEYPNPGLMMDSQGNLYGVTAEGGPAFTFLNGGNDAYGTIFKYSIASGTLTTLAAFDGLDGYKPTQTRVTSDGSGNLWGATYQGGVDWNPLKNHLGWGTVWEISSTGAFTPGIAEFSGPDGANAIGNLALDSQNNLWGATNQGGIGWNPALGGFGNGTLFELSPALVRTSPARFIAPAIPASGPVFDSAGNLYSTMTNGGLNGQGSLYELSPGGVLTTLVSFDKATTGQMPNAVTMDSQGNLYGTTQQGGLFNFGTLWKYAPASGQLTILAQFNGLNGQNPSGGLTLDANGDLVGTTVFGGPNQDGNLYAYSPATGVLSTLFNFDGTNNGSHPEYSVLFDSQGNLYGTTDDGGATGRGILYTMSPISTSLTLSSITVSPTSLQGGGTAQGTVTLSGPAPSGGLPVVVGSNSSFATPAGPVTVPAGATSATFTITTQAVTATTAASIVARLGSSSQQTSLTLTPPTAVTLTHFQINPDQIEGAGSTTGTVTLNRVAPAGGTVISLSSDSSFAGVPSGVTISAGSVSANFTITTQAVSANSFATITATLGSTSLQATLEVTDLGPIQVGNVSVDPTTVSGGSPATGVVSLSRVPTTATVVALSSSGPAGVPASVTVPAGYIQTSFPITTSSVNASSSAAITASLNGSSLQTTLSLVPASSITLSSFTLSQPGVSVSNGASSSVIGGFSSQGILNLTGPAPTGGLVLTLSSSNSSLVSMPPNVTIPVGNATTSFGIITQPVTANTNVVITATLGNISQQVTLTLTPPPAAIALASFTLNPTSVSGGSASQGTVTLNAPAPSGGTAVTFTSNNAAASVPASIVIPAGSSTGTVTITALSVSATTKVNLFAGTVNNNKEAVLTITPGTATIGVASVSLNPTSVQGGNNSQGTVTLSAPAPSGGIAVTMSSSTESATLFPVDVIVPAGATSATFTVSTSGVSATTNAIITATLGSSSQSATLTITPASAVSLSSLTLNPTSIRGGNTSQGTVTLSGAAPSGGAVIALSSSNTSVATAPASVTVAAGKTSATFTISTQRISSNTNVTISASYSGVTRTATLTVTSRH